MALLRSRGERVLVMLPQAYVQAGIPNLTRTRTRTRTRSLSLSLSLSLALALTLTLTLTTGGARLLVEGV